MPDLDSLASIPGQQRWRGQKLPAPVVAALFRRTAPGAEGRPEPRYLLTLQRFDRAPGILHYQAEMVTQSAANGSGTAGPQLVHFEEVA